MANFNKVLLMGNLTRDPELRATQTGTQVAKFGLAVNRKWKDQAGEQREDTCFVDCTAFGRTAEVMHQYLTKGRPVFIEGRLSFSTWTTQEGQKRSKLEVIVETFQFLATAGAGRPAAEAERPEAGREREAGGGGNGGFGAGAESEIPF